MLFNLKSNICIRNGKKNTAKQRKHLSSVSLEAHQVCMISKHIQQAPSEAEGDWGQLEF